MSGKMCGTLLRASAAYCVALQYANGGMIYRLARPLCSVWVKDLAYALLQKRNKKDRDRRVQCLLQKKRSLDEDGEVQDLAVLEQSKELQNPLKKEQLDLKQQEMFIPKWPELAIICYIIAIYPSTASLALKMFYHFLP